MGFSVLVGRRLATRAQPKVSALVISIVAAFIVLFYELGVRPIELWDESRLANNAIEMAMTGFSLITTYDGMPDHWNTKPPLLIWMMAASLKVFGNSEFSVRLPGALATFGTAIALWAYLNYQFKRPLTGCLAVLLLLSAHQYIHEHGARSGNYEPLLGLFMTGYVLAAFTYVAETSHRRLWLVIGLVLAFLAFMTKTIQALLFFPAIALFFSINHARIGKKDVLLGVALFTLLILLYYLARESVDPGYIAAVIANDVLGRYATTLEGHKGDLWFYVFGPGSSPMVSAGLMSALMLALFSKKRLQEFARFILICMVVYMVAISTSGTKLPWYAYPVFPLAAISNALFIAVTSQFLALRLGRHISCPTCLAVMSLFALGGYVIKAQIGVVNEQNEWHIFTDACNKALLSDEVRQASMSGLAIYHPGYANNYYAPTSFYAKVLGAEGGRVFIVRRGVAPSTELPFSLACGPKAKSRLEQRGLAAIWVGEDENITLFRNTAN